MEARSNGSEQRALYIYIYISISVYIYTHIHIHICIAIFSFWTESWKMKAIRTTKVADSHFKQWSETKVNLMSNFVAEVPISLAT